MEALDFTDCLPAFAQELHEHGDVLLVLPEQEGAQEMVRVVKDGFERVYRDMFGAVPVMHVFRKDGDNLVLVYHRPEVDMAG